MAEENQVEPQQVTTEPQQVTKEPQQVTQVTKEPQVQRVTTENPKKVEAGKRLAERKTSEIGGQRSKPILWNWDCYSSRSYRWSWLLHLPKQKKRATTTK